MNKIKPIYIVAGVATLAAAWWALSEPPAPPARERTARAPLAAKGSKVEFTKEDYEAKFSRVASAPRNVFRPLILGAASSTDRLAPNEIPSSFTGGEGRWSYTGTAIIDGAPQALVENSETGEGEFLSVGQRWKSATVQKITPTNLVLAGPGGAVRTMDLMRDPVDENGELLSPTVRPVSPMVAQGEAGRAPGAAPAAPGQQPPAGGDRGGRRERGGPAALNGPIGGGPVTQAAPAAPAPAPLPGADAVFELGGFVPDDAVIDLSTLEQQ